MAQPLEDLPQVRADPPQPLTARVGEQLTVTASIVSRGERAGWVLMSLDLEVCSAAEVVMTGRATVTFPLGEEA